MYEIEISKPISLPSIPVDLYFFQGDRGPEKLCVVPEVWARNFPKISQIVLFLWVLLRQIYESTKCISLEIGFYDAKYKKLRPIFVAVQKNIFGKVV